ncbi:MAG: Xaa-Pro peptidase family protein [Planctomycetes bacterium]|nr:Xaa-Pro peptidase family protein [Planctomycetota bacterium]
MLPRALFLVLFATLLAPAASALQQQPEDGRRQGILGKEWHAERRAVLMEEVGKGLIVLRGAPTIKDYREFRQDNNFWYYTGVTTPNAVLILCPETGDEYLLTPPVDPRTEVWVGDLIDPDEAKAITGIENCMPTGKMSRSVNYDNLTKTLNKLLGRVKDKTFYIQEQPAENWMMSRDNLQAAQRTVMRDPYDQRKMRGEQFGMKLKELHGGTEVKDITVLLDALRVIKTPEEVELMREACRVSGAAHEAVMTSAKLGAYEWEMASQMTGSMLSGGAMGPAYMAIVGTGPNACILHYSANNRKLQSGDAVMIDYGAEVNHYVADISRTWPADAKFTERQREVYQAVYDAQEAAFAACKPGMTLGQVHRAAYNVLKERGFADAFWHGTSHWLGMATHDVGRGGAKFEPGMVFTVEPGVYLPNEDLGVRIEDVVLITEDGHEVISSMIPRSIEDIEALRAQALNG